ncbi:MAG: universal stress protein [Cyclobacteriaceae bacterium]|nr:universal stress protein [Cyclobacteriaceae bacterium]
MKKILVPCDFSEPAIHAFRVALDIATISKGEVMLLNIIETPFMQDTILMPTLYFEEQMFEDMKVAAQKNFNALKSNWVKDPKVKVTSFIEYGGVSVTVEQYVKKKKADLIVMGTAGASGTKEFFIGSNTEKIVRSSSVPVIAIKKYVKASSIRNIVFPNTLGQEHEAFVTKVKQLQNFFKARLHIVYINTPANFRRDPQTRKDLKAFAKRFMLKDFTLNVFNDIDPHSGIVNFANEIGADLVAMSTHGRRGLSHLMTGSIAEDLVNHIDFPIWISIEK